MAHEKTYLVAIFKCLLGYGQRGVGGGGIKQNYICNAKALPPSYLIFATTAQRAVKIQFQLRHLRKYLPRFFSHSSSAPISSSHSLPRATRKGHKQRAHSRDWVRGPDTWLHSCHISTKGLTLKVIQVQDNKLFFSREEEGGGRRGWGLFAAGKMVTHKFPLQISPTGALTATRSVREN